MVRTPDGQFIGDDALATREQALVFEALDRGLGKVRFPASKADLLNAASGEKVLEEPDVRLGPFLETLPERRFEDADAVERTLNETWSRASATR